MNPLLMPIGSNKNFIAPQPPMSGSTSRRTSLVADYMERRSSAASTQGRRRYSQEGNMSPRQAAAAPPPATGYYLPPPGYVDAQYSSARQCKGSMPSPLPGHLRPTYGGQGSWQQTSSGWAWSPLHSELAKNPAARWVEESECGCR